VFILSEQLWLEWDVFFARRFVRRRLFALAAEQLDRPAQAHDDLGDVAIRAVLVLVFAGASFALHQYRLALAQIVGQLFGPHSPHDGIETLRVLELAVAGRRDHPEIGDRLSSLAAVEWPENKTR